MANFTDPYNPIFYAQEGLIILEQAMGMARRIHRGHDEERKSANKGDIIQIKRPSTFTTQAGGTGTVQDLNPEKLDMTVDNWREVKFGLTDKEIAYTGEQIVSDHISPAIYALAGYIEDQLVGLYKYVPWSYNISASPGSADIVNTRKVLRDVAGNLIDTDMVHFALDSTLESNFLNLSIFHAANIAGQDAEAARMRGSLGVRFGVEHFVQQNLASHTGGTLVSDADVAGTLNGAHAIRATSVSLAALGASTTIKAGDSFVIAGNTQRYVVTADTNVGADGAAASVPIYPALKQAYDDASVVTFESAGASNYADAYNSNIMFHKNAFALAMAPLPNLGDGAGARMSVITDPRTGLSMRARVAYDDTNAKIVVTLDILFGVKCIEPNLAVIARRNA